MTKKKKYLHEPKPGYIYVRKGGKYRGRIKAPEGTEEFDRQYWEILNGKRVSKTSISALISSYKRSDRWASLKANTRRTYEAVLVYLEEKNGEKDATRVKRHHIVKARDANKKRPRFANHTISVLSVLYEHAIDIGWVDGNPAKGILKLKMPGENKKPHVPWTDEACETFRNHAHRQARLAFELGIGSVQRPADLVEFSWADYDGEALDITQGKTDKRLWLPCTRSLKKALDDEIEILGGTPHPSSKIITGTRGGTLRYTGLAQMMRKERVRLGVELYDLHALRYRGVMELAWAGCSDDEIMAYSGHDTKEMVAKYAGEARQRMRAVSVWKKRSLRERG